MLDAASGQVQAVFVTLASAVPQVQSGQLRALGVGGPARLAALPEVPTFAEQGIDLPAEHWWGILAPARTPPAAVARLAAAFTGAMQAPRPGLPARGPGPAAAHHRPGPLRRPAAAGAGPLGRRGPPAGVKARSVFEFFLGRLAADAGLWADFTALCDCGGRLAGTPSEASAFAFTAGRLAALGPVRDDPTPYAGWTCHEARITDLASGRELACAPLLGSAATPPEGLVLETIDLGRGAPAQLAGQDVRRPGGAGGA